MGERRAVGGLDALRPVLADVPAQEPAATASRAPTTSGSSRCASDDTLALCENAKNLPIYALEGGADDNVPPQQPRLLVERLMQLGYDVTYKEVPGMGHWWDDPATPGTDCVDSAELNAFWESHVRNPLAEGDRVQVR